MISELKAMAAAWLVMSLNSIRLDKGSLNLSV